MRAVLRWTGVGPAVMGALVLGSASTFGDWLWAEFLTDGAVLPGVVHGLLFFVLLAVVLASAIGTRRAWRRLLLVLPLMGLMIAAGFYPVAILLGYIGGLMAAWIAMWVGLACTVRWAKLSAPPLRDALVRGAIAALGSGLAFWAISGIWTNPAAHTEPLSLIRLASWTFAFLPGMAALLITMEKPDGLSSPGTS